VKRTRVITTVRGAEGAENFGVDCVMQRVAHG
jgi:hypothetical protein